MEYQKAKSHSFIKYNFIIIIRFFYTKTHKIFRARKILLCLCETLEALSSKLAFKDTIFLRKHWSIMPLLENPPAPKI